MKKTAVLLSIVSLLGAAGLASCNNTPAEGSDGSVTTSEKPSDGKIHLDFWVKNGTSGYYTNLVEAFNTAYPDIEVEVTDQGDYTDIDQKINQGIAAQNIPNIALTYPDYVAGYLKSAKSRVLDMSKYMNDPEIGFGKNDVTITYNGEQVKLDTSADDLIGKYLDEGSNFIVDSKKIEGQYELPLSKSTEMLFVNKDILTAMAEKNSTTYDAIKEKLATWEGVWEVVDMLKSYDSSKWNGKAANTNNAKAPLIYEDDTNFYITLSQQLGIPYVDGDAANPVQFGFGDGKTKTADLLIDLATKYNAGDFVTGASSGMGNDYYATSSFANEDGAMIITTTAGLSWLTNYTGPFFDIDVLPMPTSAADWVHSEQALPATADPDAVISQGPGVVFFDLGNEKQNEAAWLFYKTITSDFLNAQWVSAGTYAPIRTSVYETDTFKDMFTIPDPATSDHPQYDTKFYPAKELMYDVISSYDEADKTFTTDVFPGSGGVRTAVGDLLPGALALANNTDRSEVEALIDRVYAAAVENLPSLN